MLYMKNFYERLWYGEAEEEGRTKHEFGSETVEVKELEKTNAEAAYPKLQTLVKFMISKALQRHLVREHLHTHSRRAHNLL